MPQMPYGGDVAVEMLLALPLYCQFDEQTRQTLVQQGVPLSGEMCLKIIGVSDLGDVGGVSCVVRRPDNDATLVVSITNLMFPEKGEIYDMINHYRKARIEWLKAEEDRDRALGLGDRIKVVNTSRENLFTSLEMPMNGPCPCQSGLNYDECCGK
ncbi:MAG: SEC-C domain-containing protein [Nitrososphaerota archaeon]|jgi:hypothetical protein|uniref:SEC-C metal-binding domain-containing protein n=1 Tax=Candidatus Bathycorpusculum sp. TaxID=2994959 RepID=UPI00282540D1|nr:SEC-C domain-containing protein [Candidatus Termitimicrobium sp.]MCL2431905.1 SEC-C domain-containing protein [Candidatus Termitimicrobium sp.]MDR0492760.1 SEC-C domain-containing protein [Nitrososphaerota archaeon]